MTDPHRRGDSPSDADSSDETIIYTFDQQHSTYGEADADAVSIKGIYIKSRVTYLFSITQLTHAIGYYRCR